MNTKRGLRKGLRASGDEPRRTVTVSVRLSPEEAARLNAERGGLQRGAYLRRLWAGAKPTTIPELNRTAYSELARASGNLNQAMKLLQRHGVSDTGVEALRAALQQFRLALIGAERHEGED